jgi:tryptophan 2,3-dioxygenase
MEDTKRALTYSSYLKIDELLSLQAPRTEPAEHDEMLFIVIHQVYELWFKQMLHEGKALRSALEGDDVPQALHSFKRVLTILKTLVAQVDVLETMTPVSFNSFRARLESASGFQSRQFRMFEMWLGKRDSRVLDHYKEDPRAMAEIAAVADSPSLYDTFLGFLARRGFDIPKELLSRAPFGPVPESEQVRRALVDIYRRHPTEAAVCERLVDLDEGLQEWRYRHVKMVERTIGMKSGTGGSSGADYLRNTLFRPLFPDLWAIRSEL